MGRMLRQAFRFLLLLLVLSPPARPQEVVIETRSGGRNYHCYQETSGHWWDSAMKSGAPGCTANVGSRFLEVELNGAAEFVPELPSTGRYEVLVTWPKVANAKRVKYSILSEQEGDIRFLDQDGWGGIGLPNHSQWRSLGSHALSPGTTKVIISGDKVTGAAEPKYPLRVYADAIKFVPAGHEAETRPVHVADHGKEASFEGDERMVSPTPVPAVTEAAVAREAAWREDLVSAMREAKGLGKPVLIYFFSSLADGCQRMDTETWTDESVLEVIAGMIPVRVDVLHDQELASRFRIFRVPAFVILSAELEPVERVMEEFFTPEEVVRLLRDTVEEN